MNKIYFVFLFVLLGSIVQFSNAQQLAFPGAEGFGRFAVGGRNGTVYHVTNLNDSGEGSLRDAVSQPNRIVVFDVSGTINISSRIVFSKNLTIAGQTAPGDGITIYGNGVSFSGADDMICRYLRVRMGTGGDSGKDAAGIANGQNMIFDHVSTVWGKDENFSINWDSKGLLPTNITIQNSIIGQGLQTHSCGGLIQTDGGVSLFRNLYIDNKTRNPKVKGLNQFVNNVVYNWGNGGGYILGDSEGTSWATIVDNYFIVGPAPATAPYTRANQNFQLYATGNYYDNNVDGTLNGTESQREDYGDAFWVDSPTYWETSTPAIPQAHPTISAQMSAADAYNWIVENAGVTLPSRDAVDSYMIEELTSLGTKGALISSESALNLPNSVGYVFNAPKLVDSDNDGIPDVWENILGTNPNLDDAMVIGSDGYANIERYINSISDPIEFLKYPVNISLSENKKTSVVLSWVNLETSATSIIVEKSTDNVTFSQAAILEGNATSAEITGLAQGTVYYFRMKAVNATKESCYSETFKVETDTDPIAPQKSITPTPANNANLYVWTNITLSWVNNSNVKDGDLKYDLYLGKTAESMAKIASGLTTPSYLVSLVDEGTTYYWKVDATNNVGTTSGDLWTFTSGQFVERKNLLYIPFDETDGTTAEDKISGAIASSINMTPSWEAGKFNNSIVFAASSPDSRMTLPNTANNKLDNGSFTISLWFKSLGNQADSYLIQKGTFAKNAETGATGRWWGIQCKSKKLTFGIDDDSKKTNIDVAATTYLDNNWHHIACVRSLEEGKLLVYLDGMFVQETADKTGAIGEDSELIIGNSAFLTNPFEGSLDELKIFDSALTPDEINKLYLTNSSSIENNILNNGNKILVYPNPFTDSFKIVADGVTVNDNIVTVSLHDLQGRIITSRTFAGSSIVMDNLSHLTPGVYFVTVRSGNLVQTHKLIKE
ncbi:MAG: LamG-like jellyroll fold domain-containing protein [Dysgonomonas sp.]